MERESVIHPIRSENIKDLRGRYDRISSEEVRDERDRFQNQGNGIDIIVDKRKDIIS